MYECELFSFKMVHSEQIGSKQGASRVCINKSSSCAHVSKLPSTSSWSPYPCPASASPSVSLQSAKRIEIVGGGHRRAGSEARACTYGRGRCCGRPWGHPPGRRSPSTSRRRRLRADPIDDLRTTTSSSLFLLRLLSLPH